MASIKKDKNSGKWYCRISFKDEQGKFKTKSKFGFGTKKEAEVYAASLELKKKDTPDLNGKDLTIFANYFEEWCNTYIIGKYSKGTDRKYEHEIELVENYFGEMKLVDLTRTKYQAYINERGMNKSKNTVQKTHGYLKKCLSYAIADGLIKTDPSFGAVLHYDIEEQARIKHLNQDQATKLLNVLNDSDDFKDLMLYIALTTGLRIGEVFGLSYKDIAKESLSVNRGYDYKDTFSFTKGKTKSSIRTIATTPELYAKVQKHKIKCIKYNKEYLFMNNRNRPIITYTGLSKHFKKILSELNLPKITIHALRHTHASLLLYAGVNIGYISQRLGHSNISETLNTYTHIVKELEQQSDKDFLEVFKVNAK
ncbi:MULTISPECIES: tyrosine-type recombinase/integrase [unclassified Facklamia]|uniref:tyrosine-type recombinase/integrase n=1 Tax=Aerococcaceae TaxID=186827 RepID=UPI0013D1FE6B|nr:MULTISPECIES: tyrosine-type recombinase/integrase [unclassified Facklamia]QQD66101.1 site-specific integrase [Aerococcaceae bacterium zg-252]